MASDRSLVGEIAGRHLPDDIAAGWLRLLRPATALRVLSCGGWPPGATAMWPLPGLVVDAMSATGLDWRDALRRG